MSAELAMTALVSFLIGYLAGCIKVSGSVRVRRVYRDAHTGEEIVKPKA